MYLALSPAGWEIGRRRKRMETVCVERVGNILRALRCVDIDGLLSRDWWHLCIIESPIPVRDAKSPGGVLVLGLIRAGVLCRNLLRVLRN